MEQLNKYKYQVAYYVNYYSLPESVIIKKKVDKSKLLYATYILLHEESFEPIIDTRGYGNLSYTRYLAIQRVKNFERLQNNEAIINEQPHKGLLINDFFNEEFEVLNLVEDWETPIFEVIPVLGFCGENIYHKDRSGFFQIYALKKEFEIHRMLGISGKGYFLNGNLILEQEIDYLLFKNDDYRFIFYTVEIKVVYKADKIKVIRKEFKSSNSILNRDLALMFLNSFYNGLFFESNISREPKNHEKINNQFSLERKLFAIPCPYWKRDTDVAELINEYGCVIFENDFNHQWETIDKLEEENEMFRKYLIDTEKYTTNILDKSKGIFIFPSPGDNNNHILHSKDESMSYCVLKGSNILLNGKIEPI